MKDKEIIGNYCGEGLTGSIVGGTGWGAQGWICPKCGAVLSPYTSFCPFCAPKETTISTGTSTNVDWMKYQSIPNHKENKNE